VGEAVLAEEARGARLDALDRNRHSPKLLTFFPRGLVAVFSASYQDKLTMVRSIAEKCTQGSDPRILQQAELLRAAADPMDAAFQRRSETRVAESAAYGRLQTRKIEAMDTCRRIGFDLTGRFPFNHERVRTFFRVNYRQPLFDNAPGDAARAGCAPDPCSPYPCSPDPEVTRRELRRKLDIHHCWSQRRATMRRRSWGAAGTSHSQRLTMVAKSRSAFRSHSFTVSFMEDDSFFECFADQRISLCGTSAGSPQPQGYRADVLPGSRAGECRGPHAPTRTPGTRQMANRYLPLGSWGMVSRKCRTTDSSMPRDSRNCRVSPDERRRVMERFSISLPPPGQ
jgi:hypothetical protein